MNLSHATECPNAINRFNITKRAFRLGIRVGVAASSLERANNLDALEKAKEKEDECVNKACKKPIYAGEGRYRMHGYVYCVSCGERFEKTAQNILNGIRQAN